MSRIPATGHCTCSEIKFRVDAEPMMIHCCHCTWCQRETGAAFAINAMVEASRVVMLAGQPEIINTPSNSGKGQRIARCPKCHVAVWSNYAGAGPNVSFVRVGTLEEPGRFPPDVHIFTASKQPWVVIPDGSPTFSEFYDMKTVWAPASLDRLKLARSG